MKKINIKRIAGSAIALALLLSSAGLIQAVTYTQLTGEVDYGQTSNDVTNLQTFLASSPSIYPQGRITGFFGPLTKSAVMNFQNAYGIAQVGRVGPQTLAKINSLISSGIGLNGSGGGTNTGDVYAPAIYSPTVSTSNTSANVSWGTDQPATGQVYYSSTPFQIAEATSNFAEPTIIGGSTTPETTSLQTNQNVSIQNLQPNTLYYYMIEATDSSGNLTYTWSKTFTTKP